MLRNLLGLLSRELSAEACMENVATIIRHHRIQASPGYRAAANDCLAILRRGGVEAKISSYPATGRTRAWTHLTPQEWDCADAECWLLGPDGERRERLAWYPEMNLAIIQRSCATPAEGVTAELAVVENAEKAASWQGADVAGKIVLVGNGDPHAILRHAQRAGAVGLLTARMTYHPPIRPEGDLADALQYTSFWWAPEEAKGWGFVLSTRQGDRLKAMVKQGPVRLWARVDARFYDGAIENLEALIPGETPEEVLVISHLCHPKPSTNDNATGPATVMEAARALNKLIEAGQLPRPRRAIRFLHPPEMTGTYEHLAALSPEQRAQIVGALNIDMIGQKQEVTGSVLLCEYPPVACPSYAGDLMALVLEEVAAETTSFSGMGTRYATFRHAVTAFSGGSDHYICADPTVGIPCPMVIQWPDRFYHTSADSFDKVDPAMMKRVGLMTAAYAYFLATAGAREVAWLAGEMAALFPQQLREALRDVKDLAAALRFRKERKLADLDSLRRLVPAAELPAVEAALALASAQIAQVAEAQQQRLALVDGAAAEAAAGAEGEVATGVGAAVNAVTPGWQGEADLSRIVPRRVHPGPISLREYLRGLPEAEAQSWSAFSAAHPGAGRLADYLCYWTDGARSLAEVCRLAELETGLRNDSWALGYFQLLGRLGLVAGV